MTISSNSNMAKDKRTILIIVSSALLLLVAFGAWRLLSTSGQLAPGTTVGTVSIGGLTSGQAAERLRQTSGQEISATLPNGKTITLPAVALRPRVSASLRPIAAPNIWQRLSGQGGNNYPLLWSGNKQAVKKFQQKINTLVSRSPRSARWQWAVGGWQIAPSRPGVVVAEQALEKRLQALIAAGGGALTVPSKKSPPELSTAELRQQLPTQLLVDQSERILTVYRQGRKTKTYPVAVGQPSSPTPNGNWTILDRAVDPVWLPPEWAGAQAGIPVPGGSPNNPLVSRWLGIGDGVGIHGTRDLGSLGSEASRGCIRMNPEDVEQLYELVPIGTPLRIQS